MPTTYLPKLELNVRGMAKLESALAAKDKAFIAGLRDIVHDIGEETRDLTAFLSPWRTGYMSTHVKTVYSKDGLYFETGWSADDFLGKGMQFYPYYQEFGTVHHPAQPSLGPAFDHTAPEFKRRIELWADKWALENNVQ